MSEFKGWHFLPADECLSYGDGRKPADGEELEMRYTKPNRRPILCEHGMHASARIIDALKYTPGPVLCRVVMRGNIKHDTDKTVARYRTVLWRWNVPKSVYVEFANFCRDNAKKHAAASYAAAAACADRAAAAAASCAADAASCAADAASCAAAASYAAEREAQNKWWEERLRKEGFSW